jgi:DNA-binding LytR/AlgR family response regulator
MPEHSGLEIAKLLKEKQPECLVIFLTSFKEYAVDAFELEIFRYIPKDQLELRFEKYFMEAVNLIRELDEKAYIVEGINSAEKLPFKSIRYLKKQGKYTSIVCTDNRETKVRKPINVVIEELNSPDFVVIDRGCAVNVCYISRLCDQEIHLKNGERLAVSRSNLKTIRHILVQYWGEIY